MMKTKINQWGKKNYNKLNLTQLLSAQMNQKKMMIRYKTNFPIKAIKLNKVFRNMIVGIKIKLLESG